MKKLLLLVILGSVVTVSIWRRTHTSPPAEPANKVLIDRIWIDHLPRGERDTINVFAMVSEHSIGVFQATSQWRGAFEAFRYEASGGEVRIVFPQNGDRETMRAKARKCSQDWMDFCLEVDGVTRGVKKYYSREGWEIGNVRDIEGFKQRLAAFRQQLQDTN